MAKFITTPWRAQADLLDIRKRLYYLENDDTESRRHAVDRIMAWKLRGNLPHAVESTALLVDAILHDGIKTNSIFSVRAVYSAAFCRFVTGFCDIGRHKERTLEPSSMLDIAKQIGMPAEFVVLRHEATHEELPGIQRLVVATQQALGWLWNVYWSRLEEPTKPEVANAARSILKQEAATTLRNFRRSRRQALRSKIQDSSEQFQEAASISNDIVDILRDDQARVYNLTSVLVEEHLLLPSNRELGSSLDGAHLIWDELLAIISSRLHNLLSNLVTCLLEAITKPQATAPEQDSEKEALSMWLLHLVEHGTHHSDIDTILAETMKTCCLHPGCWSRLIGQTLLEQYEGKLQADWQDLFEASLLRDSDEVVVPATGNDGAEMRDGGMQQVIVPSEELAWRLKVEDEYARAASWTRAIAPTSLPIGVIY